MKSEMYWLNEATLIFSKKKQISKEVAYIYLEKLVDKNPEYLQELPNTVVNTL